MAILHRSVFLQIRDLFTELDLLLTYYDLEVSIEHLRRV